MSYLIMMYFYAGRHDWVSVNSANNICDICLANDGSACWIIDTDDSVWYMTGLSNTLSYDSRSAYQVSVSLLLCCVIRWGTLWEESPHRSLNCDNGKFVKFWIRLLSNFYKFSINDCLYICNSKAKICFNSMNLRIFCQVTKLNCLNILIFSISNWWWCFQTRPIASLAFG